MATKEKVFDVVGFIMDADMGNLSDEAMIEGMQHLIDSGTVGQMQGSWGRLANRMIEAGLCHKA
jgi:hypothetical protein